MPDEPLQTKAFGHGKQTADRRLTAYANLTIVARRHEAAVGGLFSRRAESSGTPDLKGRPQDALLRERDMLRMEEQKLVQRIERIVAERKRPGGSWQPMRYAATNDDLVACRRRLAKVDEALRMGELRGA